MKKNYSRKALDMVWHLENEMALGELIKEAMKNNNMELADQYIKELQNSIDNNPLNFDDFE